MGVKTFLRENRIGHHNTELKTWRHWQHKPLYDNNTNLSMTTTQISLWQQHKPLYDNNTNLSMTTTPTSLWQQHKPLYDNNTNLSMTTTQTSLWQVKKNGGELRCLYFDKMHVSWKRKQNEKIGGFAALWLIDLFFLNVQLAEWLILS